MKRLAGIGCVLALAASLAWAVDLSALQPQGYVSDFAGVVDARTKAALEQYCAAVEHSTGAQMALVTLPTIDGEPIEDVTNELARNWGVGKKETNEGVVLLLVIGDRLSRLEVGYGLEPILPDGYSGQLLRDMRPALRANDYGQALAIAAQQIGERIAKAKGVAIQAAPAESRRPPGGVHIPFGSLLGGLIFLIWLMSMAGSRRGRRSGFGGLLTGLLIGSMLGRGTGGRYRSGGGFGGFDSGGGFGGFGGGDFGGGGASSSW